MKKYKGRIILIFVILLVVLLLTKNATKPKEMEKTAVKQGRITSVVEASGEIQAEDLVDLAFTIPGKVVWVGVKKGDWVEAYQTLATMDQREVAKTIKNSLLDYMVVRWNFEQLRDDYDVDGRPLYDVPGIDDTAKRLLEKSQFGLDQSVLDHEIATLASEQYYLMAPFSGVIVNDGNLVAGERLSMTSAAAKQIRIINPETLYFRANVDEIDYAKIKVGQEVDILLDSFPNQTFSGTVGFVGKEGELKTGGSVQIPVDIFFDARSEQFVPELNGDVEIILKEKTNVIVLDKKFVSREEDKYTVSVLKDGKIKKTTVQVGLAGLNNYEILEGLSVGDIVVREI